MIVSRFGLALALLAAIVSIPSIMIAAGQYVDYDGYWHLFIARQGDWERFLSEIRTNAHPPLYFILLKNVLRFGDHLLVYRAISLASAAGATFLIGKCMRFAGAGPWAALLAAFAFGAAPGVLALSLEIRSYLLAVFFILLAFYFVVGFVAEERGGSRRVSGFLLSSAVAVVSHYFSFLFLAAVAISMSLLLVRDTTLRQRAVGAARSTSARVSALVFSVVAGGTYIMHAKGWIRDFGHLPDFYYAPGGTESPFTYLLRTGRNEVALFTPFGAEGDFGIVTGALYVAGVLALVGWWLARGHKRNRAAAAILPPLMFVSLLATIVLAALLGRYPFGGLLRQQFVLFPFLVLSVFCSLQIVISRIQARAGRHGALAILTSVLIMLAVIEWRGFRMTLGPPYVGEVTRFRTGFPAPEAVLVDQFSLVPFFSEHTGWRWRFDRILRESSDGSLELYELTRGNESFFLCRERYFWTMDLTHPALHSGARECLDGTKTSSVAVFSMSPEREVAADYEERVRARAAEKGLVVGEMILDLPNVYFSLARAKL